MFSYLRSAVTGHTTSVAPPHATAPVEGTLPASWYTDPYMYALDRRAIHSKYWTLISHTLRFPSAGTWVKYVVANYPIFVTKDRKGNIRAFHDLCRHRAYPVLPEEQTEGTSNNFPCLYHDWVYTLEGKLAGAPQFDAPESSPDHVPGFDKTQYPLFQIHVHVDDKGFIWVNLDASPEPTIPWEEFQEGADTQPRLDKFNFDDYQFDHCWSYSGDFNWKVYGDNYNECYHCRTAHPGIAAITDLKAYNIKCISGRVEHYAPAKLGLPPEEMQFFGNGAFSFLFPTAAWNLSRPYFYITRIVPTGPEKVSMEYQVFRNKNVSDADFVKADKFFKDIENEDFGLCEGQAKNFKRGIYRSGALHPNAEEGVLRFKALVKSAVMKHRAEEVRLGKEINLGEPNQILGSSVTEEEEFCRSLCPAARELPASMQF